MSLLLALPALFLAAIGWYRYRRHPIARPITISILLGIGYWYILPGTVFLQNTVIQDQDSNLLQFKTHTLHAIWLVNISLALLLMIPEVVRKSNKLRLHMLQQDIFCYRGGRVYILLLATLVSAVVLLAVRFAEMGPAFALNLIIGMTSAREVMSFENFSTSVGQSLIALWELLTVFSSTFLAATFAWSRQTTSIQFSTACLASILLFVSSGTRSVLLLLLFAVLIAILSRPATISPRGSKFRWLFVRRFLFPALLTMVLVILAAQGLMARFENDHPQAEHILLNSLVTHNDMFRELMFSIRYGDRYRSDGLLLLQTPITFAMPSFLGFEKSIPPHLIDFNFDRAGIDLLYNGGNVFPGLIGEMYLCFGEMGPLILVATSIIFFWVFWITTLRLCHSAVGAGLFITLLAYYIISFRNMQGSLGILAIMSYFLTRLLVNRSQSSFRRMGFWARRG